MSARAADFFLSESIAGNEAPERDAVLAELERLLESSYFRYSRKYPAFLRYIVEKTLKNEAGSLKERTIGVEVFGRDPDYPTNDDPVVRVTAGEVRKRIAQYYQTTQTGGVFSIHLPVGSYVPQFNRTESLPVGAPPVASREEEVSAAAEKEEGVAGVSAIAGASPKPRMRKLLLIASAAVLVLLAGVFGERLVGAREVPGAPVDVLDVLWGPLLQTPRAVLIYAQEMDFVEGVTRERVAALSGDDHFRKTRLIPTATMTEIAAASGYLMVHHKPFNVQPSSRISFYELQAGPFVVLGEPDDPWVQRLTENLRYHIVQEKGGVVRIADRQNPGQARWALDTHLSYAEQKTDYAILSRVLDPTTNQYAIVATGLGERGLFAAGRFLRSSEYGRSLAAEAASVWNGRANVEIVVSASVIDGVIGPPHVEASWAW